MRLAVLGLAALASALIGAASPTPDLGAYLAPPPSSDWVEAEKASDVMAGPFTAHDYGVYVEDSGSERALNRYGFVAGYGTE